MKAGLLRTQFSYQNTVVREKMKEKTKESVSAVVPITIQTIKAMMTTRFTTQ